jgi:hypothetical protein
MKGYMMQIEGANATDNMGFTAASSAASFTFRAVMSPRSSADDCPASRQTRRYPLARQGSCSVVDNVNTLSNRGRVVRPDDGEIGIIPAYAARSLLAIGFRDVVRDLDVIGQSLKTMGKSCGDLQRCLIVGGQLDPDPFGPCGGIPASSRPPRRISALGCNGRA